MSTTEFASAGFTSGGLDSIQQDGPASTALRPRWLAVAIVGAIHLALLWALAVGIGPTVQIGAGGPQALQIQFLSPNLGPVVVPAPPLDWTFDVPKTVLVPEPQIVVTPDQEAGEGIVGSAITRKLSPRLDPKHVNERPQLPHTMGAIISALSLELRILVLPDGSVANAEVVRSTGESGLDRLAIETVERGWRYLPASINGKPIAEWTTVIVRFASF